MNLYEILGVDPKASEADIKRSYRSLAQKYHPDKDGDPEVFRAIQTAYDTLSNPEKRAEYDRTGEVPKAAPALLDEAVQLLSHAVDLFLQKTDPDTSNLIQEVEKILQLDEDNQKAELKKMKTLADKARRAAKRTAVREGKSSILPMILLHLEQRFDRPIQESERHLERIKLAREVLNDHSYQADLVLPGTRGGFSNVHSDWAHLFQNPK